jgi:hypothetical protein
MKRRRLLLLAALLVVLVTSGFALLLLRSASPISQAGCDRIENGMSASEVESIFGGPEGNYHERQVDINIPDAPQPGLVRKIWIGNDGAAFVYFDQGDEVRHVHFAPALNRNESFFEKIRRWLNL